MPYTAQQVAEQCVDETRTRMLSGHAVQVALVAISLCPDGAVDVGKYRRAVRRESQKRYGSLLLMLVLPIIVNLVTAWVLKWWNQDRGDIREQARCAL